MGCSDQRMLTGFVYLVMQSLYPLRHILKLVSVETIRPLQLVFLDVFTA
jgi:hypothetical protein